VLGAFLRDVITANPDQFRIMGPDETPPTAWARVRGHQPPVGGRDSADRRSPGARRAGDGGALRAPVPGLAGGLPAHRPARLFNCYEAFIHIIDSMFNQHAKWLKTPNGSPGAPGRLAQLPAVLARVAPGPQRLLPPGPRVHRPRGQQEGRDRPVYLPPDANCLLSVADHCLRSRNYVNVIVAGKQPSLNYLTMDEAIAHCTRGIGIWEWASERRRRARRGAGLLRRRPDARDAGRGRRSCASTCPS
jgi:xylulose-5-phosphate/fructose-6-phosphate phosphoketolase